MGYRAHIRTKSIIEYDTGRFNHCIKELSAFIKQQCPNANTLDEWENPTDSWEIPIDEIENMIKNLNYDWEEDEIVFGDYTAEDLIDFFSDAIDYNKVSENYSFPDFIYIDWF